MISALIVDDDFRVARVHALVAGEVPGVRVVGQVHTASAALEAIANHQPDLLLLDLYLPDANGLVLLRRVRALQEAPDVIVLSAANDVASVRTAMRGGALHFLIKPFELDELKDLLVRYVELHEQRSAGGVVDQRQVDQLFGALHRAPAAAPKALPKGLAPSTVELVLNAVGEAEEPITAVDLAEQLGISRATAHRYLGSLAELGQLRLERRYGSTGRPEHRYGLPD